jgi:D-glycero-alpha-D-manno-heptose-7-phosphate kinase
LRNFIFSRAPTRICDIGGWTDTWFYPKGAVFNFSVDLYSYVRISKKETKTIKINSENLDINTEIRDLNHIEYDGTLDLLKAAIKRLNINTGLDIYVRTDSPPACGIGTSASISVALIAALARLLRKPFNNMEIADLAHKLETEELKLESGVQDQYAAAFGGINLMEINYPQINLTRIKVNREKICKLENQMILIYFSSRSSNLMHKAVIDNYKRGEKNTVESFELMERCAYDMKKAIESDNLKDIGVVMNENWNAQKKLHPSMTNPLINKAERIAREYGAIGFKLNGAGGGGSATILADFGCEYIIEKKLVENEFQLLPFRLNFNGVETWGENI